MLWLCLDGKPFLRELAETVGDDSGKMDKAAELHVQAHIKDSPHG